jgi:hypothetical protein
MRSNISNNVLGTAALAAALLIASSAFAGDQAGPFHKKTHHVPSHAVTYGYAAPSTLDRDTGSIVVKHMNEANDGMSHWMGMTQSQASVASVQAEIKANPAVAAELRARGVQIKNVVGRDTTMNGQTIYYVQ